MKTAENWSIFFYSIFEFPVKEIITNWFDELIGLAAAFVISSNEIPKELQDPPYMLLGI